jgi:hypothetical protein
MFGAGEHLNIYNGRRCIFNIWVHHIISIACARTCCVVTVMEDCICCQLGQPSINNSLTSLCACIEKHSCRHYNLRTVCAVLPATSHASTLNTGAAKRSTVPFDLVLSWLWNSARAQLAEPETTYARKLCSNQYGRARWTIIIC